MAEPRDWATLLRGILAEPISQEARADSASAGDLIGEARRARARLLTQLSGLLGQAGATALWQRSVILTRRAHPELADALAADEDRTVAFPLDDGARPLDVPAVERAAIAVLANFVTLLVSFIGEPLTLQVLGEVWPDVASRLSSKKESP